MLSPEVYEWLEDDNRHKVLVASTTYLVPGDSGATEPVTFDIANSPYIYDYGVVRAYDETLLNISDISSQVNSHISGCTIRISNIDGMYDDLLGFAWEGNEITIQYKEDCNSQISYTIFTGYIDTIAAPSYDIIELVLTDAKQTLDNDIQNKNTDLFNENNTNIEALYNTPKPICYGKCYNISPVLVDSLTNVYMIHNGPIHQVIQVRENGSPLYSNDLPVGDPYYIANVNDQDYSIQWDVGTFTLARGSFESNGVITCDVVGKRITYDPLRNYFNDAVDYATFNALNDRTDPIRIAESCKITNIIRDIADSCVTTNYIWYNIGSVTEVGSFKHMQNTTFNNEFVFGMYIKEKTTGYTAIEDILKGVSSYIYFDNNGLMNIQQIIGPEDITNQAIYKIDADSIKPNGISVSTIQPPIKKITTNYKKNYTVQSKDSLAAELTETEMSKFTEANLVIDELNSDFLVSGYLAYPNAEVLDGITIHTTEYTDAHRETLRRLELRKQRRYIYSFKTVHTLPSLTVGEPVNIIHERFNLGQGQIGLIVSSSINPLTRQGTIEVFI